MALPTRRWRYLREDGAPPTGGRPLPHRRRPGWEALLRQGVAAEGVAAAAVAAAAPAAANAPTASVSPCQRTPVATLSDPGIGRNKGGISPRMVPASISTVVPVTPSWAPGVTAASSASSEGEAAAVMTASSIAAAEGPTTGAGCPAANAATKSGRFRILRFGAPYKVRV